MHADAEKKTKILDLENGLSIWKAHLTALREQDINARVMEQWKFDLLVETIRREKRLESLPLCTLKKNRAGNEELLIISGHHRVRAARAAGLTEIYVLVNDAQSEDEIRSKQLAHNALSGYDNAEILKQIYDSIQDIEMKILSGITEEDLLYQIREIEAKRIDINLNFELMQFFFLPEQLADWERVVEYVQGDSPPQVAEMRYFQPFSKALRKVGKNENIRNVSAILAKIIEIVKRHYEERAREAQQTAH
ncbi:MAG: ParB N-terminal domain-containing protein [candidate division KSB1 bacterium]|nr:ParB N-terminal domain-containing protein [candidate division KSB1 bacterium]